MGKGKQQSPSIGFGGWQSKVKNEVLAHLISVQESSTGYKNGEGPIGGNWPGHHFGHMDNNEHQEHLQPGSLSKAWLLKGQGRLESRIETRENLSLLSLNMDIVSHQEGYLN